jgi:hypothetical protein
VDNNYLNITKTSGINIVGGSYIGGNFWATPSGTGLSQTCTDPTKDGICDSNYTFNSGNVDYLPLAVPPPGYINGTVKNNSAGVEGAIVVTNTIIITSSNLLGFYSLLVPVGTYNLTVTKEPEYYSNTSVTVEAISGTTVEQDIELLKKQTGNITGSVTN